MQKKALFFAFFILCLVLFGLPYTITLIKILKCENMDTLKHSKWSTSDLEEFLTIQQARERLQCSRSTIYNLLKARRFHKFKLNAGTRLSAKEIQDYMEQQKQTF